MPDEHRPQLDHVVRGRPPLRGNPAANVVGILNDAREFALWSSEHILVNVVRFQRFVPSSSTTG